MIILGIDPGFSVTGYCILKKDGRTVHLIDFGYLKMSSSKSLAERVEQFYTFFVQKIRDHQVSHVALETPFLGKNAQNFLKLGYLRGTIYLLSQQHKLSLFEFSPREVKQAVTGFGGASKDQVARVVFQLFPRMKVPDKLDVTDAVAVTLCGLWKGNSLIRPINY